MADQRDAPSDRWTWAAHRPDRAGWLLWAVYAVVVATVTFTDPATPGQVYSIYREASLAWHASEVVYRQDGTGFLYLPSSAVLFTPFALLPFAWAATLWRIVNIGLLAAGLWRFCGAPRRQGPTRGFLLATLVVTPLVWSCARHGQMTLAMAALLLAGTADLAAARTNRAAVWLCLALAVKPLALVVWLLVLALHPAMRLRLALGLLAVLGLPFLTQSWGYALEQYQAAVAALRHAAIHAQDSPQAQVFWSLRELGVELAMPIQTGMQAAGAVATLALCWLARRRCPPWDAALLLYTLGVGYLLLFSHKTERNTYALLAPPMAMAVLRGTRPDGRRLAGATLVLAVLFLASNPLGRLLTGGPTTWLKPLLCLAFLAVAAGEVLRARSHARP